MSHCIYCGLKIRAGGNCTKSPHKYHEVVKPDHCRYCGYLKSILRDIDSWNNRNRVRNSMRIVALDTESTGFSPTTGHRIIEIGCVEIEYGKLTGREFHRWVNPERSISKGEFWEKPSFFEIEAELTEFLRGAQVIAHNASFDERFLDYELSLTSSPLTRISSICEIIDTLQEARIRHPGQPNNLDYLCQHYSIDTSTRDKHGALLDARLLAQMWLAMTGSRMA